jgi:polar amino acid transport system substrate-binding protein
MQPNRTSRWRCARLLLAVAGWVATVAAAQGIPYVPPELYQEVRRVQGDTITFCIWPVHSPTAALDRRVAQAIGEVLLVDVALVEFTARGDLPPDEFLEEVYIQLGTQCDAIGGFILAADNYPEWLVPTRPYLYAPYLAIVREDSPYARLGDVPGGAIIGSQVYTQGDLQLQHYLASVSEGARWRRFPYGSMVHMAGHLRQGTLEAGLVWQPSWAAVVAGGVGGLRAVPTAPLPTTVSGVGFVGRSTNTFLRSALDSAIAAMDAEGMLVDLADRAGLLHVTR